MVLQAVASKTQQNKWHSRHKTVGMNFNTK